MSDTLDSTGLTLQTLTDLVNSLTASFQAIYGSDINIESDTPDGQALNIFAQAAVDLREILQSIYNSMDPDQASGTTLDQRVGFNGIKREGATYTITPVDITASTTVALVGLDANSGSSIIPAGVFTVQDTAGNQWALLASDSVPSGVTTLNFRAGNIGNVQMTLGSITTIVTPTAGITSVNNSSGVITQGLNEETDSQLRTRRKKSIANVSTGYLEAFAGSLETLTNITQAIVYENDTTSTDSNGIPAHGIWVIVNSGGVAADIANMIYAKRAGGIAMKGSQSYAVTRPNGSTVTMYWDNEADTPLYVKFNMALYGDVLDTSIVKTDIVDNVSFLIGEEAGADVFVAYVKGLYPKYTISGAQVSLDGSTWTDVESAPTLNARFTLSTANITITTS